LCLERKKGGFTASCLLPSTAFPREDLVVFAFAEAAEGVVFAKREEKRN
jgi:hypothetical protein